MKSSKKSRFDLYLYSLKERAKLNYTFISSENAQSDYNKLISLLYLSDNINFQVNTYIDYISFLIEVKSDFDAALKMIEVIINKYSPDKKGSVYANIFALKAQTYWRMGDIKKAIKYYLKGISIAEEKGYKNERIKLISNLGILYCTTGNYDDGLNCYFESYNYFLKNNDPVNLSFAAANIANLYDNLGERDIGFKYAKKAHFYAQKVQNKRALFYASSILAEYESNMNKKLELLYTAKNITEELGEVRNSCVLYCDIGLILLKINEVKNAQQYFLRARDLALKNNVKDLLANSNKYLGYCFALKGDQKSALRSYNEALKIFEGISELFQIQAVYHYIGLMYHSSKDFSKAIEYFSRSYEILKKMNYKKDLDPLFTNMGDAYIRMGNIEKARECFHMLTELSMELNDITARANSFLLNAKILNAENKYKDALYFLDEAQNIFRSINLISEIAFCNEFKKSIKLQIRE